ncbi:MAG: hypothetical protein R6V03_08165 [Kiritimatiellia bacterium]
MTQIKPDLAEAQERVEAWWRRENTGRPILQIYAPRDGATPYDGPVTDDMDAWWTDPEYVLPRLEHRLLSTYYAAEAMPVVFPVSVGIVSITTKYLGGPNVYLSKNTTWSNPIIEDWDEAPSLEFDENNTWWRKSERLLKAGVKFIKERGYDAFVGVPDLNGPTEVLSGLREAQKLAMDFYDCPERIKPALRKVQDAWFEAYRRCTAIARETGGYLCWLGVWSEQPMSDLQSDFSCLISRDMYDEYFLPFIVEQAGAIDRTIYHLDGPGAVRHLESLLAIEELDAIQWVQGAGGGEMTDWIDLLKRIQAGGKLIHAGCRPAEVPVLCRELDPSGLLLGVSAGSQAEADDVIREAERASR